MLRICTHDWITFRDSIRPQRALQIKNPAQCAGFFNRALCWTEFKSNYCRPAATNLIIAVKFEVAECALIPNCQMGPFYQKIQIRYI